MNIYETVLDENPNDNYWWSKWPKEPSQEEQEVIDFLLERHPKTIALGIQSVADLMLEYQTHVGP